MPTDQRKLNDGEQGSGSGLDADLVDSKESVDIEFSGNWGNLNNVPTLPEGVTASEATEKLSVDGKTIIENANGNIQVAPNTVIIGDFEANSIGNWTTGKSVQDTGGAEGTTYYVGGYSGNVNLGSRNYDFSEVEKIIAYIKNEGTTSSQEAVLIIDGTDRVTIDGTYTGWNKVEVDTTNLTGSKTIDIESRGSDRCAKGFDRVKAVKSSVNIQSVGSGAGN